MPTEVTFDTSSEHQRIESVDDLLALRDREFVRACYFVLLRRAPESEGEKYYLEKLRQGVDPLEILTQIQGSDEWAVQAATIPGLTEAINSYKRQNSSLLSRFRKWLNGRHLNKLQALELQLSQIDLTHTSYWKEVRKQLAEITALEQAAAEMRSRGLIQIRLAEDALLSNIRLLETQVQLNQRATSEQLLSATIHRQAAENAQRQFATRSEENLQVVIRNLAVVGARVSAAINRNDVAHARLALPVPFTLDAEEPVLPRVGERKRPQITSPLPAAADQKTVQPLVFSILMPVYKTPLIFLSRAIESVFNQSYPYWELCICDDGSADELVSDALLNYRDRDPRVKLILSKENSGISVASNRALELATGGFVALLDHDDELTADALQEFASVAADRDEVDVIYSDQDKIDGSNNLLDQFYKPDWSPDYFRRVMYVGHLLAVRTDLMREVGGFDPEFDRVQDYELMLRVVERARSIHHIPKILYRWRAIQGSIAAEANAKGDIEALQCRAVSDHLSRIGLRGRPVAHAKFPHRVKILPESVEGHPLVSIVVPTRDHPEHIGRCLESLFHSTTYSNIEVVVVDNGTTDLRALEIFKKYPIVLVPYNEQFNYSAANNLGVLCSSGEYIVLLNNDTEVITKDWLEILIASLDQDDVDIVGGLLLYPDMSVQHAGVVIGPRGTADHVMRGFPSESDGYAGSLSCVREVSAVTGACLMTRRSTYDALGGLEEHYATHYQDVDFCLKARSRGKRVLHVPDAKLFHFESATRGSAYDLLDRLLLQDTWRDQIGSGDPYFNSAFSLVSLDYSLSPK